MGKMLGMNGEEEGGEDSVLWEPLGGRLGAGFSLNPQHPTENEGNAAMMKLLVMWRKVLMSRKASPCAGGRSPVRVLVREPSLGREGPSRPSP